MLIAGGGLAGLSIATRIHKAGVDFCLLEARSRFGGRIHSPRLHVGDAEAAFDLGPAWFWPGQERMAALTQALDLTVFEQFDRGALVFEDERSRSQRIDGLAPMAGSLRIDGGMAQLVDGLVRSLPAERLLLDAKIAACEDSTPLRVTLADGGRMECETLVLALPPRVAAGLHFEPSLGAALHRMEEIPTWMAGHAKIIALYESPVWRDAGLSGDAMSRRGPLVEIHDASPRIGGPFALFGFVGTPADIREQDRNALLEGARGQLIRLFGTAPTAMHLRDWALEAETSTTRDRQPLHAHPDYGLPATLRSLWGRRLVLASSETVQAFGGYLEGALEAAEAVSRDLIARFA